MAPAELESVLSHHPAVADSAIVGVYFEAEGTEVPRYVTHTHLMALCVKFAFRGYIVPKDASLLLRNDTISFTREINAWLSERVAHYKLLRGGSVLIHMWLFVSDELLSLGVVFVKVIPRNPAGKILRRLLRQPAGPAARSKL